MTLVSIKSCKNEATVVSQKSFNFTFDKLIVTLTFLAQEAGFHDPLLLRHGVGELHVVGDDDHA